MSSIAEELNQQVAENNFDNISLHNAYDIQIAEPFNSRFIEKLSLVKELVDNGIDLEQRNEDGDTFLCRMIKEYNWYKHHEQRGLPPPFPASDLPDCKIPMHFSHLDSMRHSVKMQYYEDIIAHLYWHGADINAVCTNTNMTIFKINLTNKQSHGYISPFNYYLLLY
jgi:hypothetical protein